MKGRLVALVGVLCIASLVASGVDAKGKPDKPGKNDRELIVFTGDLDGSDIVEGCCPNGGPFPAYELTVGEGLEIPADTYSGFLFMNSYGAGRNREYVVQFWGVSQGGHHIAIEIIGGLIDDDKKNKITTVTFVDADCEDLETGEYIDTVSFILVRTRL